jgi:MobA/MobL family protein
MYHLQLRNISRSKGANIVAKAAYRSGTALSLKVCDEETGLVLDIVSDYSYKSGVAYSRILAPNFVCRELLNRGFLWNHVEKHLEKRKDSRLAKEIIIALPKELSLEQNIDL